MPSTAASAVQAVEIGAAVLTLALSVPAALCLYLAGHRTARWYYLAARGLATAAGLGIMGGVCWGYGLMAAHPPPGPTVYYAVLPASRGFSGADVVASLSAGPPEWLAGLWVLHRSLAAAAATAAAFQVTSRWPWYDRHLLALCAACVCGAGVALVYPPLACVGFGLGLASRHWCCDAPW